MSSLKATIRIPTEQYAYIEVAFEGSPEEIVAKHNELYKLYNNPNKGLPTKDWNRVIDRYLDTCNLSEGEYNSMSDEQKAVIQELKKAFKRADAKSTKGMIMALETDQDRALEHKFHTEYDEKCSECYKQRSNK